MFSCNNKHKKKEPHSILEAKYHRWITLPASSKHNPKVSQSGWNPDAGAPRPPPAPGTPEIYDHAGGSARPAARTSSASPVGSRPTRANLITMETLGGGGGASGVWGWGGGGAVLGAEVRLKGTEPRLDSGSINWIPEAPTHT